MRLWTGDLQDRSSQETKVRTTTGANWNGRSMRTCVRYQAESTPLTAGKGEPRPSSAKWSCVACFVASPQAEAIARNLTMQQFMWQPNMLQVAKFLDAGMKRLQTVDPNEGSNI